MDTRIIKVVLAAIGVILGLAAGNNSLVFFPAIARLSKKEAKRFEEGRERKLMLAVFAALGMLMSTMPSSALLLFILAGIALAFINAHGYDGEMLLNWAFCPVYGMIFINVFREAMKGNFKSFWMIVPVAIFFALNHYKTLLMERYDEEQEGRRRKGNPLVEKMRQHAALILIVVGICAIIVYEINYIIH